MTDLHAAFFYWLSDPAWHRLQSVIQAGFVQLFVISWQYQHVLKHEIKQAIKAESQKGHKLL